jgi:hypothetical protein
MPLDSGTELRQNIMAAGTYGRHETKRGNTGGDQGKI